MGEVVVKVGVIGLGLMGEPVARRLLNAGHDVVVTSRRRESALRLEVQGATWRASAIECARGRETVLMVLPDSRTVEAVALAANGAISGRPRLLIDMSTSPPSLSRRISEEGARKGVSTLDAPMSGGPAAASSGNLSIMVGGDVADFEWATPILECLGRPRYIGPAGNGQSAKIVNQVLVAATTSGVAEAWAVGAELGLDVGVLHDVLADGIGAGRLLEFLWPRLIAGDMSPGFKIDQMIKDMRISIEQAHSHGLTLAVAMSALSRYEDLSKSGRGQLGTQALVEHGSLRSEA